MAEAERAVSSAVVINLMVSDVAAAVEAGTFDSRPERVLVRYHGSFDQQGWEELSELYTNTMYRSIEIHRESVERMVESGEQGIPAGMHTLMFEMPNAEQAPMEGPMQATLQWVDGGASSFSASGGSEGREPDEGDPEG
jgi:hypothetical protein